jgi:gamma-glutamylcyclotransferase (GGCT)/AIG2-like uncharacterized protein YtfP
VSLDAWVERLRQSNADLRDGRPFEAFGAEHRLVAYGTLCPGRSNHDQLAEVTGSWQPALVTGRQTERDYPVFTYDPTAGPVDMWLLMSTALAAAWPRLDAFEGTGYRRILVPARLFDGSILAAFLYEAVVPVD